MNARRARAKNRVVRAGATPRFCPFADQRCGLGSEKSLGERCLTPCGVVEATSIVSSVTVGGKAESRRSLDAADGAWSSEEYSVTPNVGAGVVPWFVAEGELWTERSRAVIDVVAWPLARWTKHS